MAEANFYQQGDVIDYTPVGALAAGQVVEFAACVGIPKDPIAAGALGALSLVGVFKVTKAASQAWAIGELVYWDDTANNATTVSTSNIRMGIAAGVVGAGATELLGLVKIYPNA